MKWGGGGVALAGKMARALALNLGTGFVVFFWFLLLLLLLLFSVPLCLPCILWCTTSEKPCSPQNAAGSPKYKLN
jgi:hypothetical protein